jgi:FHS family L-fucose permease-like MFS transporter
VELSAHKKPKISGLGNMAGQPWISLVFFLFFARGFSTVLIDTLIPKLKSLFALSYAEAMLTQLCFFFGYLVFSIPAAMVLARVGYIRTIVLGLAVMTMACVIFCPAALLGLYAGILAALFVLAAGMTVLQVATIPLVTLLGPPKWSHSRLTLAQAFNSLGTTVGPLVGAWLILGPVKQPFGDQSLEAKGAIQLAQRYALERPFLAIGCALAVIAAIFWFRRQSPAPRIDAARNQKFWRSSLFRDRRFVLGAISIFVYVGAEVSIGSIMVNYLMQGSVLSVAASRAGQLVSLYWGGAMLGRFIGSAALRTVPPGIALSFCASLAALLAVLSFGTTGVIAGASIIAIGLCNSIMFPTIFALAIEDLGDSRAEGSGILCMANVGGAIVPLIAGIVADVRGLTFALLIPVLCYVWIAIYGSYSSRYPSRATKADLTGGPLSVS